MICVIEYTNKVCLIVISLIIYNKLIYYNITPFRDYRNDADFNLHARMITALAFVPPEDVAE